MPDRSHAVSGAAFRHCEGVPPSQLRCDTVDGFIAKIAAGQIYAQVAFNASAVSKIAVDRRLRVTPGKLEGKGLFLHASTMQRFCQADHRKAETNLPSRLLRLLVGRASSLKSMP